MFAAAWEPTYAPEFWVGVVRQYNATAYSFAAGGEVPPIDGLPLDEYVTVLEPECADSIRGCCCTLTDRMLGPYLAYQTARSPRLFVRNCLNMWVGGRGGGWERAAGSVCLV